MTQLGITKLKKLTTTKPSDFLHGGPNSASKVQRGTKTLSTVTNNTTTTLKDKMENTINEIGSFMDPSSIKARTQFSFGTAATPMTATVTSIN